MRASLIIIWQQVYTLERFDQLRLTTSSILPSFWRDCEDSEEMTTLTFLSVSFVMILCFFAFHIVRNRLKKTLCFQKERPLSVLQVLSAMFTPVAVAWPFSFISYFEAASSKESQSIELEMSEVIGHICMGRIELRDSSDLLCLFQDKLLVYGIKVKAHIKSYWWLKTVMWTSAQLVHPFYTGAKDGGYPFFSGPSKSSRESFVDLDIVSPMNLRSAIIRIQLALPPGSRIVVDFSCLSNSVGFLTSNFFLCAIPFLPYLLEEKKGLMKTRQPTPLFTSMQKIISLFSDGYVRIETVRDISLQHAASLLSVETDLVNNKKMRMAHIAEVGLQGWREDRLMLVWEASLLGSGLLSRWRIQITK